MLVSLPMIPRGAPTRRTRLWFLNHQLFDLHVRGCKSFSRFLGPLVETFLADDLDLQGSESMRQTAQLRALAVIRPFGLRPEPGFIDLARQRPNLGAQRRNA